MITPKYMEDLENNKVIQMYSTLSQQLTRDIIKKVTNIGDISSYTKHQIKTLQKIGGKEMLLDTLMKSNRLTLRRKKELKILFKDIFEQCMQGKEEQYARVGADYIASPEQILVINSALNRTNKEFSNLTKSVAYASRKAYIEAVDNLYIKVTSGGYDYDRAIKSTVNDLANQGITLQDKLGRNIKLESQVRSNLMTSLTQTANDINKSIGDIIGANCVVIGHSPKCRPTHIPIDAVTLSIDKFKQLEYLTQEPNCYHVVNYDWQEQFEDKRVKTQYSNEHLSNSSYINNYNKQQKQNYYARMVRNKKEEVVNVKRTGNTEVLEEKKAQLRLAQSKYRAYSLSNNLDIDYSKCWKAGYNK